MAFSTVYDVKLRYSVDNRASRGVQGLTNDTRQLKKEVAETSGMFAKLGAGVGAYFGLREGAKALIGFNSTVEDTKLQIGGMLALARKTDLTDELKNADRIYASLQKRAATLPGTTQEYVKMAGAITQPIIDAGLTMKDLEDLTVNSVVAAKGLGEQWEVAARDIDQALRGQFHATDPFASKVLQSIGYKGEEGRSKFNAMNAEKRASELKRGLSLPQWEQLAKASGQTFSGALSTLQDTIGQFVGKIGLPLFQAITAEVKRWNEYLDKNNDIVQSTAKTLGEGLVTGFRVVKDALGFLVSHADTLLAIGKVWAAVKIGGMLTGLGGKAGGLAGTIKDKLGWFRGASDSFDAEGNYQHSPGGAGRQRVGLKGAAQNAGMLLGAGLAGYELGNLLGLDAVGSQIGTSFAKFTGRMGETEIEFERLTRSSELLDAAIKQAADTQAGKNATSLSNAMGGVSLYRRQLAAMEDYIREVKQEPDTMDKLSMVGRMSVGGNAYMSGNALEALGIDPNTITNETVNSIKQKISEMESASGLTYVMGKGALEVGISQLTDYQKQTLDQAQAQNQVMNYIYMRLRDGLPIEPASILDMIKAATADPGGTHKSLADKPNVNVHIARIEVQSDDPDRMAFGLLESFRDAAKNPSSALSALREG